MKTSELIQSLSTDLQPTSQRAVLGRIVLGLAVGAIASTLIMLFWLGVRPDIGAAVQTGMFWVKFGYAMLLGLALMFALDRLSRPAVKVGSAAVAAAVPVMLMFAMGALRLALAAPGDRLALLMGSSSDVCPWRIFVIGLPILAGAVWAVRGLAPTRLTIAGLAAGGCAGAFSAVIYGFHCDETAAPFVALWYTLGMAAVAARRALRWS